MPLNNVCQEKREYCVQAKHTSSGSRSKGAAEFLTPRPLSPKHPTDEEKEEPVRPSSPKYDERTFFYTTPQVKVPQKSPQKPLSWDSPILQKKAVEQTNNFKRKFAPGELSFIINRLMYTFVQFGNHFIKCCCMLRAWFPVSCWTFLGCAFEDKIL